MFLSIWTCGLDTNAHKMLTNIMGPDERVAPKEEKREKEDTSSS